MKTIFDAIEDQFGSFSDGRLSTVLPCGSIENDNFPHIAHAVRREPSTAS